jgi:hypothetical protein
MEQSGPSDPLFRIFFHFYTNFGDCVIQMEASQDKRTPYKCIEQSFYSIHPGLKFGKQEAFSHFSWLDLWDFIAVIALSPFVLILKFFIN